MKKCLKKLLWINCQKIGVGRQTHSKAGSDPALDVEGHVEKTKKPPEGVVFLWIKFLIDCSYSPPPGLPPKPHVFKT